MSPSDTRSAILDLAEELLQARSFNAFSYQDIAERIGIRKASIHYHFATKEDLGVALVERFRRRAGAWSSRLVERDASPLEKLRAYFEVQAEVLDQGTQICAQGILGAEFNALPERVQGSYAGFLEEQQVWLARILRAGREQALLAFESSPEERAVLIQAAIQGALQIARASGRPERFHAVIRELESGLVAPPAPVAG